MTTPITPADARFLADEIALQGSTGIARKVRSLADQVESLTKERDKLKEAAKLALEALDEAQTYAYNVGKALDEAQKYTYNVGKYMHNVPQAIETLKQAGVQ